MRGWCESTAVDWVWSHTNRRMGGSWSLSPDHSPECEPQPCLLSDMVCLLDRRETCGESACKEDSTRGAQAICGHSPMVTLHQHC